MAQAGGRPQRPLTRNDLVRICKSASRGEQGVSGRPVLEADGDDERSRGPRKRTDVG